MMANTSKKYFFRHTSTSAFKIVSIFAEMRLEMIESTMAYYRKERDCIIGRGYIIEAR